MNLKSLIYSLRSNFWLIPALLGLLSMIGATAITQADLTLHRALSSVLPIPTMSIDSARLALSTVAGSMITIASLVFSMTLVALTLVSQQLGPRILMQFMDDRQTQLALGIFVATFIFALVVLLRIGEGLPVGENGTREVPAVAIFVTALLAILALAMMVQFIHHIATRIQADVIIHELGVELNETAAQTARIQAGNDDVRAGEMDEVERRFDSAAARKIALPSSGYLHQLDAEAACALAGEHDLCLKMLMRPGQFVLAGRPVFAVAGEKISDELEDRLCSLASVGSRRTPEASVEFEISALVEVALRALSPGINDPFTAISCIDRLTDGMRALMQRRTERRVFRDDNGTIRLIYVAEPFRRYLDIAFTPIRQSCRGNTLVLDRLSDALSSLEDVAAHDHQRKAIRAFAEEMSRD
jgi:uncharacterized membrane protein